MKKDTKVLFRLDDICPQMNHNNFLRMRSIFEKYNVKPIIGVIPCCIDSNVNIDVEDINFWDTVRQLQLDGWKIAMHGCYHQYVTKNGGILGINKRSEFAGLTFDEQLLKIQKGVNLLEKHGISTDLFMAPSHSFDMNTIRALKACGFKYVTDGLSNKPYEYIGVKFIPCKEAKISKKSGFSTVCYHTNYINDDRYVETENYCKGNIENVITFEEVLSLPVQSYFTARVEEVLVKIIKYRLINWIYPIFH